MIDIRPVTTTVRRLVLKYSNTVNTAVNAEVNSAVNASANAHESQARCTSSTKYQKIERSALFHGSTPPCISACTQSVRATQVGQSQQEERAPRARARRDPWETKSKVESGKGAYLPIKAYVSSTK